MKREDLEIPELSEPEKLLLNSKNFRKITRNDFLTRERENIFTSSNPFSILTEPHTTLTKLRFTSYLMLCRALPYLCSIYIFIPARIFKFPNRITKEREGNDAHDRRLARGTTAPCMQVSRHVLRISVYILFSPPFGYHHS